MSEWLEAADFIEADVIRWTEGVYDRKGRSKKSLRIGERRITAEVLHADPQWVQLLVRACEITRDEQAGRTVARFKPEEKIKRARKTVLRGNPERLSWADESARHAVSCDKNRVSRFAPA